MLTLGCGETFGLATLVFPKQTVAAYGGLRLEADTIALLLRVGDNASTAVPVAAPECNLALLLTLPLQSGQPSLAQIVQGAFTRRPLPRRRFVERLEALARLEEERFGLYSAPLLDRLRADLDRKAGELTALLERKLLVHGFEALAHAVERLADEVAHLTSDQGPLAQLYAQLDAALTPQLTELDRVKQRLRRLGGRLLPPLATRRRSKALKLAQDVTLLKLLLRLCRAVRQEDPLFRDFAAWLRTQRGRLQTIRDHLVHRQQAIVQELHELTARDPVLDRAGRGVCLTGMLQGQGHGLEEYYQRATLDPLRLAHDVAATVTTAEPEAVLAVLQDTARRQGREAVAPLSLVGVLSQLDPPVRQRLLTTCLHEATMQLRLDTTVYVTRGLMPVTTRVCVVPGGQESPVATWLKEIVAEPWEFVHRDTEEEICFLTTVHRILPEALIGHRLLEETYQRFPRKEWLCVLNGRAVEQAPGGTRPAVEAP